MTTTTSAPVPGVTAPPAGLSPLRLHLMRGAFLLMGVGLAVVKWPLLPRAHDLPLFEGVTLSLLTAMSVLALVGVLRPARMLPLLVLESLWKVLWLGIVALPQALSGGLDRATSEVAVNCSLVVVIIAAVPWGHVGRSWLRPDGA